MWDHSYGNGEKIIPDDLAALVKPEIFSARKISSFTISRLEMFDCRFPLARANCIAMWNRIFWVDDSVYPSSDNKGLWINQLDCSDDLLG